MLGSTPPPYTAEEREKIDITRHTSEGQSNKRFWSRRERERERTGDDDVLQELVEFLVVADGQHDVSRDDARLLVVTRCVTRQLYTFTRVPTER
jgi:hypothetical protein